MAAPVFEDGYVKAQDGTGLYYRQWSPPGGMEVASVILFIHGIGLHGGSPPYGEKILIGQLMGRGAAFYSVDLRGHGRSGGSTDGISRDALVQDIGAHVARILERHKGAGLFLYGHDFGGMLALNYASAFPKDIRGVIVSEYSTRIRDEVKRIREPSAVAALRSRIADRIRRRPKKLEMMSPSDYQRLCDKYELPLNSRIMKSLETSGSSGECAPYGKNFFAACGVGREAAIARAMRLPLLMVFSRNDPFFDVRGAYDILARVQSYDKELVQVDSAGHYGIIGASRDIVGKWVLSRSRQ